MTSSEPSMLLIGLGPFAAYVVKEVQRRLRDVGRLPVILCSPNDVAESDESALRFQARLELSGSATLDRNTVFSEFREPHHREKFISSLQKAGQVIRTGAQKRVWIVVKAEEEASAILGDAICAANQTLPGTHVSVLIILPDTKAKQRDFAGAHACLLEADHLMTRRQWVDGRLPQLHSAYVMRGRELYYQDPTVAQLAIRMMVLEFLQPYLLSRAGWSTAFAVRLAQSGVKDPVLGDTEPILGLDKKLELNRTGYRPTLVAPNDAFLPEAVATDWQWTWLMDPESVWDRYATGSKVPCGWLAQKYAAYVIGDGRITDLQSVLVWYKQAWDRVRPEGHLHAPVVGELLGLQSAVTATPPTYAEPRTSVFATPPAPPVGISQETWPSRPTPGATTASVARPAPAEEQEVALAAAYGVLFNLSGWMSTMPESLNRTPTLRKQWIEKGAEELIALKVRQHLQNLGAMVCYVRREWPGSYLVKRGLDLVWQEVETHVPEGERELFRRLCEAMAAAVGQEAATEFAVKGGPAGYSVRTDGGGDS